MVKFRYISFEDLDAYCHYIHSKPDQLVSLNEFIQEKYNLDSDVKANLSKIIFDEKHRIDLTNANLSDTILDNIDFNGKNIVIKGADLRGSSTNNSKFTNFINLEDVEFGDIKLDRDKFFLCQLKGAKYKPFVNGEEKVEVKVTDKILTEFLEQKSPKLNLNQYIAKKLGLNEQKVMADLSGLQIDEKFSNQDISNSNLAECKITGKINNLTMRDCKIAKTTFINLELNDVDLRGTNLASDLGTNRNQGAIFEEGVYFHSGKLSLPTKDLDTLKEKRLIDSAYVELNDFTSIYGGIADKNIDISTKMEIEPCYKATEIIIKEKINFLRSDLKRYADYCQKTPTAEIISISRFLNLKENQIANFSQQDLSGIELTYGKIDKCNFSLCNFSGSALTNTSFTDCHLVASRFSQQKRNYWLFGEKLLTSDLRETSFINCDLSSSDLSEVNAYKMKIINSKAINMVANKINMVGGEIKNSDLSGTSWKDANLEKLNSKKSKWNHCNCESAKCSQAKLEENEFFNINAQKAIIKDASLSFSDLANGNFSFIDGEGAQIKHANLQYAILNGAKIAGATLTNSDINDIQGIPIDDQDVEYTNAIACEEQIRYAKQQKEMKINNNKKRIYREYCKNIAFTTIVSAISLPLLIPVILPASLAVVVMPIISIPLYFFSTMAVVAAAIDYSASKIGYEAFSEKIADKLGAETYINKINEPIENDLKKYKEGYKSFIEEIRKMPSIENKIIAESRGRQEGDSQNKVGKVKQTATKKFVEKALKGNLRDNKVTKRSKSFTEAVSNQDNKEHTTNRKDL